MFTVRAVLLVLSALCFRHAVALTAGAPTAACTTLTQQHPGVLSTTSCPTCPFNVSLVAIDGNRVAESTAMYRCGLQHIRKLIIAVEIIGSLCHVRWLKTILYGQIAYNTIYYNISLRCSLVNIIMALCITILNTVRVETSGATFRGLAVQVRNATGSETFSNAAAVVGEFVNAPADGDWQIWDCAAVSHLPYC